MIQLLTGVSLLLCLASALAAGMGKSTAARHLFYGGWLAALALFVANAVLAQAIPFGNMRHVLCFFPLVLLPAAAWVRHRTTCDLTTHFAAAAAIALLGALSMPLQATWRQMPALQSPWFAPHVTSYVLAYGLMAVATVPALRASHESPHHMQVADAIVRLALPFMTFGLWSGALWADAAWGRYWAWDIKETWALLTWLIYLVYLHLPTAPAWLLARKSLIFLGFIAIIITFLVVNFLPAAGSLHTYSM
ncbi:MAG: cytochrome c biogenesis protein CcsA [Akkermansia sp.]|nr:cytochrome c biogenesis protein CcsA [Akkermansia sp.]